MKKSLSLFAMILAAFGAFALDKEAFIPQGNVSSYTKTEYNITSKFDDYFRSVDTINVHVFDASGLRTETSSYNAKNELLEKLTYTYNISRNLKSSTYTDNTGNLIWKNEIEYLADGKIKSESEYNAAGVLRSKIIYKYEDSKITASYYDADGKLLSRTISTVNANDLVESEKQYFGDGSLTSTKNYTYLENGKLNTIEYFNEKGNLEKKYVYRYDSSSAISEIQTFNGNGTLTERCIYKNDAKGNPSRVSLYEISEKFGATANELKSICDYSYKVR